MCAAFTAATHFVGREVRPPPVWCGVSPIREVEGSHRRQSIRHSRGAIRIRPQMTRAALPHRTMRLAKSVKCTAPPVTPAPAMTPPTVSLEILSLIIFLCHHYLTLPLIISLNLLMYCHIALICFACMSICALSFVVSTKVFLDTISSTSFRNSFTLDASFTATTTKANKPMTCCQYCVINDISPSINHSSSSSTGQGSV
jgi:hypothetical protein